MPIAKIKIKDEVNCVIIGLTPDHVKYLYQEYGRQAEGYFFNPKFKLGQWDGYIRFFKKTGATYVFLLEDIVPRLVHLGYKIVIDDQRVSGLPTPEPIDKHYFSHISNPENGEPFVMRDYQVEAVNVMMESGGGILQAATGAGKTIMNAALVDSYGKLGYKTVTIVPSKDLIDQTATNFETWGLDVGRYGGGVKDHNHQHVVSTWQTLKNNPTIMSEFHLVVVDECHGAKGQMLQKLLIEYGNHIPLRFGLTGTLPKAPSDAMSVKICIGEVKHQISAAYLMERGHLASLNINVLQLVEDFNEEYQEYLNETTELKPDTLTLFKDGYFPDYTAEKRYLQGNTERIEWIAEYILGLKEQRKGNVFCLVNGVQFGKKLAEQIPDAIFVHGADKQKTRKEAYDLFKDNDNLVVIATVHIASTGLDIKRIFNLVFIDVGKSFVRVIQTIGRGLRKAHDKSSVNVTDICSDLKYSRKHLAERVKFYKEASYPHKKRKVEYTDVNL